MQDTLLKIIHFERVLSKNLYKVNLIFPLHPVPIYGQDYEKQKGPETSYQYLTRWQNMFRKYMIYKLFKKVNLLDYASQFTMPLNTSLTL